MATHWTYEKVECPDAPLMQGDVLWPKPELKRLFKDVHPYFCDPKYIAFIVTTQSCDLIQREGKPCKADYINLAVIRDLESCLSQFFDNVCQKVADGVYFEHSKTAALQLLERILNQNEQALGLFYLHPDSDTIGIADYAVALLRVSVAVRAKEHYQLLQGVRTGRLSAEFRNKLGWLVGNLYSRVGTPDWSDKEEGEIEMNRIIQQLVESDPYFWVRRSLVNAVRKAGVSVERIPSTELPSVLREHDPGPFKEQIAEAAKLEASKVLSRVPEQVVNQFDEVHLVEGEDSKTLGRQLRQIVSESLESVPEKIKNRLINNEIVSRAISREDIG